MPIAIVGIGCRFPGGVTDTASFWRLLAGGVDAITEIPADRFDITKYYDDTPATPGKVMSRFGGFIGQRFDEFDAEFFGISRTYAERLDPQQRLLLEIAWEALEDAGLDVTALQGTPTGVFVGQWLSDFEHRLFADHAGIDFPMTLGSGRYAVPGRLSYAFGFRGPSLSLDAGCSAGLAAVHLAVRSLRSGESTLALAGGVNVILQPHIHVAYSQSRMMAPDGRCKFGDARGDGYVRAEGAGIVVLKPLAQARLDGDRVYAVIRGSAVNNDGDSSGSMGTPSKVGQEELLRAAMRDAGVAPADVGYVEAHGTGTRAGDPVELGVLASVLSDGRSDGSKVWVGSVKSNIGHTEATAGLAGLIKGALMLQHCQIPPSLHFREPNPEIAWASVPVAIPTTLMPWPEGPNARLMGVSSFGIGGTNAHVVLESADVVQQECTVVPSRTPLVLPLSARSDGALRAMATRYAEFLDSAEAPSLAAVCVAAATRRSSLSHRAAFVATDHAEMLNALRAFAAGEPATVDGVVHDRVARKVAFVVPGQGAQWTGMARQFMAENAAFRDALMDCDAAARAVVPWSIVEQLHLGAGAPGYLGDRIDVIQPTLIALAISYAAWLRSVGVVPDAVVGHSLGEVGAAAIAGVIDVPTAMRIICQRSALMQRTSGQGAMAVVELSQADAQARLVGFESKMSVAVSNGPASSVISGEPAAVNEILAALQRDGVFCRLVKVDVASHSPQMEPLIPELVAALADVHPAAGSVQMYSTVSGSRVDGTALGAAYWGRNLRQPVQFGTAVQSMLHDGITAFVELGPHPVLTQAVQQTAAAAGRDVVTVACGRRETADVATALTAIASLWSRGVAINWTRVMPWKVRHVQLPFYPWQRQRYWADAAELSAPGAASTSRRSRLTADARRALYTQVWEPLADAAADASRAPWRWLVVGAVRADVDSLVSALRARGEEATAVHSMNDAGIAVREWGHSARSTGMVVLPVDDDAMPYAPVAGINALHAAIGASTAGRAARVWWITSGAHAVAGHAPSALCGRRAAAWGAARVIAEEHPAWWGGLVDIAADSDIASTAAHMAASVTAGDGEDQIALRDGVRHALRLVPADNVTSAPYEFRADAAYLITGGLGGVSLTLAAAMVRDGARRLVLVGRTPLPPRGEWASLDAASIAGQRVAAVRSLEHAGASVHLLTADVADETALRTALSTYEAEGWPDIAGVIHNAAVLDLSLSGDTTVEAFAAALGPKLIGAEVLDRVFPDVELFVLSSSFSASLAQTGMTSYTAANVGSDALAATRRASGRHAISVQWAAWDGVGMETDSRVSRNIAEMAQNGVASISADEGAAYFMAAIVHPASVLVVLPADWSAFRKARRGRALPLFRAIPDAAADIGQTNATEELLRSALAASPLERRAKIEAIVRSTLGGILRRPAAAIDARQPFGAMGVDSLMAVEIRNRLETALERPLSATLTWNYPTVDALTSHIEQLLAPATPVAVAALAAVTTFDEAPADNALLFSDIVELSDDDALRALRRGR